MTPFGFGAPLVRMSQNEAIRNYLEGPETKVDRVMEYSRILREEGPFARI